MPSCSWQQTRRIGYETPSGAELYAKAPPPRLNAKEAEPAYNAAALARVGGKGEIHILFRQEPGDLAMTCRCRAAVARSEDKSEGRRRAEKL